MRSKKKKQGVTLLELIAVILILSIGASSLMTMTADVLRKHASAESFYRAMVLGRDLMEEILSKNFDEKSTKTGGNWSSLGPDTGESIRTDFDDVDDFDGFTDEPVSSYVRVVAVNYIDPDDDPPSGCTNGAQSNPADCFRNDPTRDYKRIDVVVQHRDIPNNLTFSTYVSASHNM